MPTIHYFAYGSNLHPLRLTQRIPSAHLVGTGKLSGYELTFQKRGHDTSGKGHISATQHKAACVLGAVYQFAEEHKSTLDIIEGAGYETSWFDIDVHASRYSCFAYVGQTSHLDNNLQPFHWYKTLIVLGAEFHGFPTHYIQAVQQSPSTDDPSPRRRKQNEMLIAQMLKFQK